LPVFLVLALPMTALADMEDPDSPPTIVQLHVYRHLLETGDRLFVAYFNNPYAELPDDPANKTYIWELIDDDGITVLGSTTGYSYVYSGYGYQVISFYFSAAESLDWDPATTYTIKLRGNPIIFDTPPAYNFPVSSSSYTSYNTTVQNQAQLAFDILVIADELDGFWALTVSLLSDDEAGQYLSYFGQGYFRGCITSVQSMAPTIFPLALRNIDVVSRNWTDAYVTDLANQNTGTWIETAQEASKTLFVVNYDILSVIILLVLVVLIVVANLMITGDQWNGLMDASIVAILCTRIGLFGLGYLSLAVALAIVFIGIKFWGFARG